jgi:NADPH-dependent glutamate synthase beta subunit-like oxidoreductase
VVGGGATAVDCAITAKARGARQVGLFMLEKLSEMPLTARERQDLLDYDIEVNGRTRVTRLLKDSQGLWGIKTLKVELPDELPFSPTNVRDVDGTDCLCADINAVIISIGMRSTLPLEQTDGVFYAGDMLTGPKTVVQAVASGKNAALEIDAYLR